MQNPYSHAAAVAPPPSTPEAQRLTDYEAAIGPNSGYYLKYFEQFDAGESKANWHWPAFFVTSWWFLYRKMWLPGILNLLWPWILATVLLIAYAITKPPPVVMIALGGLLLLAPKILLPIYANALYWRHIHGLVERLPNSVATVPEKRIARLERNGGTGVGPMIAVLVGGGFFMLFFIGIVAAISIPAYQDYTLRAQVTEGLNLAAPVKAEIAEYYAEKGAWPDETDLGHELPTGQYVTQITVSGGSVVITYGNKANAKLMDQKLAILPGVNSQGDVYWACGNMTLPDGYESGAGPYGSDVENKYLPVLCRER